MAEVEPPNPHGAPDWVKDKVRRLLSKPVSKHPVVTLDPLPTDDLEPGQIGLLADGA